MIDNDISVFVFFSNNQWIFVAWRKIIYKRTLCKFLECQKEFWYFRIHKLNSKFCEGNVADSSKNFSFHETNTGTRTFTQGAHLFEQKPTCKQAVACFKLADTYSEGIISLFFKILVCKIIQHGMFSWKRAPICSERCGCLFKTEAFLLPNRRQRISPTFCVESEKKKTCQ